MAQIKQQAAPRPFTHAAWTETISKLGGNLESVVLDKLNEADPWFDAKVRIPKEDKVVTIDVRPSDAYVLAVISGAPIVIAETVLRRYADVGGDGLEG